MKYCEKKNIVIWGNGVYGKWIVSKYLYYGIYEEIVAIVDKNAQSSSWCGFELIHPKDIAKYEFDEIWIASLDYYGDIYKEIVNQKIGIKPKRAEILPILNKRIKDKYRSYIDGDLVFDDEEMNEVIVYLKDNSADMYCDDKMHQEIMQEIFFDCKAGLFYTYYKSKKMYISKKYSNMIEVEEYVKAVIMEQQEESPHCYFNKEFINSEKGIVVDIGAAEGIFGISLIEQINHLYLIESDKDWVEALEYTFEPYKEKVTIINKFVDQFDSAVGTSLNSLFKDIHVDLVKMDIEGYEMQALKGGDSLLKKGCTNFAICSYHRANDRINISELLEKYGYRVFTSKGYILCKGEWELESDNTDFRKGIVFATKGVYK